MTSTKRKLESGSIECPVSKVQKQEYDFANLIEDEDTDVPTEVRKQEYEVIDLVEDRDMNELIFKIVHEPRVGQWVRQIRYHPVSKECDEDEHELPDLDAVQLDFMVSHITCVSFLDLMARKNLVQDIRRNDMNAIFLVLLLLCPKLRILQIDGPTKEFGKTLKNLYERQAAHQNSIGPMFPPIRMIDIVGDELCRGHDLAWQNISTYFFIPGLRSCSVRNLTFNNDDLSPEPGINCSLENVLLQGVRILPEQLAEILERIPNVNDFCYDDSQHFRDFMEEKRDRCPSCTGSERYQKRLVEAAKETLETYGLDVSLHSDKIYVRNRCVPPGSSKCGFGLLSRPLDGKHFW